MRASPILLDTVKASLEAAHSTGGLFYPTVLHRLVAAGYDRSFEQPRRLDCDSGAVPSLLPEMR